MGQLISAHSTFTYLHSPPTASVHNFTLSLYTSISPFEPLTLSNGVNIPQSQLCIH